MLETMRSVARYLAGAVFALAGVGVLGGSSPVEASVEPVAENGLEALGNREDRPRMCSEPLSVKQTSTGAGCWIDERVTGAPGRLDYPCAGGAATATFGESQFAGAVKGGGVAVGLSTRFKFSDGCMWESRQQITGALADGTLRFSYREAPLPGQKGCSSACSAEGVVDLR